MVYIKIGNFSGISVPEEVYSYNSIFVGRIIMCGRTISIFPIILVLVLASIGSADLEYR